MHRDKFISTYVFLFISVFLLLSGLEIQEYRRGDPLRYYATSRSAKKLGTDYGGLSVDIVLLRTKATELILFLVLLSDFPPKSYVHLLIPCVLHAPLILPLHSKLKNYLHLNS
jgi:hypothetical protein